MSKLHLDYSEYKELIGDNGVTEWAKYNWLSGPEGSSFGGFKRVPLKDFTFQRNSVLEGVDRFYLTITDTDIKTAGTSDKWKIAVNGYETTSQYKANTEKLTYVVNGNALGANVTIWFYLPVGAFETIEDFEESVKDSYLVYELKPLL